MRGLLLVRGSLSGTVHLYRGRGKHRRTAHLRGGALRQRLQHRLFALHLLRLLRGGLPDRCHHAWAWVRVGHVEHQRTDLSKRKTSGKRSLRYLVRFLCTFLRAFSRGGAGSVMRMGSIIFRSVFSSTSLRSRAISVTVRPVLILSFAISAAAAYPI